MLGSDRRSNCTICGASFTDSEPRPQEPPKAAPAPAVSRTAVQEKLRKLASSGLALTIAIAFTVFAICAVLSSAAIPQMIGTYADEVFDYLEDDDLLGLIEDPEVSGYVEEAQGILGEAQEYLHEQTSQAKSLFSAILSKAGVILIAVGMWLIYGTARDDSRACCGTTGFTIIKILKILELIGGCLLIVLLTVLCGLAISFVSGEPNLAEAVPTVWGIIAGIAVLSALAVIYKVCIIRNITRLTKVASTGKAADKISTFPAVFLIIGGVLSAIMTLVMIAVTLFLGPLTMFALFKEAATAVGDFCLGRFFFRAKKQVTA